MLVNCSRGVSRSSSVCMAWLMTRKGYSSTQALVLVRQARPVANANLSFAQQLRKLEADCRYFGAALEEEGHGSPPPFLVFTPKNCLQVLPDAVCLG